MERSISRSISMEIQRDNRYRVLFWYKDIEQHSRAYITWAGANLDAKDWLTHGHAPTKQEELEELAI